MDTKEKFEKEWRFHDGDNFPFGAKRLCLLTWESRDEEVKKLRDALKDVDKEISSVPGLRSATTQAIKDIVYKALKDGE